MRNKPPRLPSKRREVTAGQSDSASSNEEYRVGWCRPPKATQFKPGQSGNPSGVGKEKTLGSDMDALLERALSAPHEEREQIVTKLAAGIETFVDQFVDGDHRARRDLLPLLDKRGLTASRGVRRQIDASSAAELRQALIDRGVPARLLPPSDDGGLEPPPDPPLPPDINDEVEP
jgi:hypothetical protein